MIYMNDLKKDYIFLKPKIDKVIERVFESGCFILGKQVEEFEKEFAKYIGAKYCVGVANGLEALQIALQVSGVGEGDEVITVSNTAIATILAITNIGARPVFVDIDDYFLMDKEKLEEKITEKTKAIIPVHLFGQVADMKKIISIAKKYKKLVIEDACQAHGASQKGKMAGSFGDLGCFSFYPTKNLGAYGDGGAIITNNKIFYEKCKMLRNYGQKNRYLHEIRGINSRLDELQAAILRIKLKYLNMFVEKRNKIAKIYNIELKDIRQIKLPKVMRGNYHAYHLYVVQAKQRDELMSYLFKNGVHTLIHYPVPIHKQKCFKEYNNLFLENTQMLAKNILTLPIHPFMNENEVIKVSCFIKKFYE